MTPWEGGLTDQFVTEGESAEPSASSLEGRVIVDQKEINHV